RIGPAGPGLGRANRRACTDKNGEQPWQRPARTLSGGRPAARAHPFVGGRRGERARPGLLQRDVRRLVHDGVPTQGSRYLVSITVGKSENVTDTRCGKDGPMLYAFGFDRIGVLLSDLYFVDPDPADGQGGGAAGGGRLGL